MKLQSLLNRLLKNTQNAGRRHTAYNFSEGKMDGCRPCPPTRRLFQRPVKWISLLAIMGVAIGNAQVTQFPVGEVEVDVMNSQNQPKTIFCVGETVNLRARITCSNIKTSNPDPTYQWLQPAATAASTSATTTYQAGASGPKDAIVNATAQLMNGNPFNFSGTNSFHVVDVTTEVNDTPVTTDDIVRKKFKMGSFEHRFQTNCRMKINGSPPSNVTIVLYSPDNRLRYPNSQRDQTFTLNSDGSWLNFYITGQSESSAIGDAVIESHMNTKQGHKCGVMPATVFTFINASVSAAVGSPYVELANIFRPQSPPAVIFSANADLSPAGLTTTAPQLATLTISFAQNVGNAEIYAIFDTPTIAWFGFVTPGTFQLAPRKVRRSKFISNWTMDSASPGGPVYDPSTFSAVSTPGVPIATSDSPQLAPLPATTGLAVANGIVTYNNRQKAGIKADFRLWCVTWDMATGEVWPLRETTWSLNASDNNGDTATVASSDSNPQHLPITTPPSANTIINTPPLFLAPVPEGGAKEKFVNPFLIPQ